MGILSSQLPEQYQGTPQWRNLMFVILGGLIAIVGAVQMARGDFDAWVLLVIGAAAILIGISLLRRQVWGLWLLGALLLVILATGLYSLATSGITGGVRIGRQIILPLVGLFYCTRAIYSHYRSNEA